MDCSACTGTWYGALVSYIGGYHLGLSFLGLPGDRWTTVVTVALCSMSTTPIVAGLVQRGFDSLGQIEIAESINADEPTSDEIEDGRGTG